MTEHDCAPYGTYGGFILGQLSGDMTMTGERIRERPMPARCALSWIMLNGESTRSAPPWARSPNALCKAKSHSCTAVDRPQRRCYTAGVSVARSRTRVTDQCSDGCNGLMSNGLMSACVVGGECISRNCCVAVGLFAPPTPLLALQRWSWDQDSESRIKWRLHRGLFFI